MVSIFLLLGNSSLTFLWSPRQLVWEGGAIQ
jgi:hypothetical protein